jgi:hypothetical protein
MLVDSKGGLIDHTVANGYWQATVPTTIRRPLRGSGGTRGLIPLGLDYANIAVILVAVIAIIAVFYGISKFFVKRK